MSTMDASAKVRATIAAHRDDLQESLDRHGASNPRLFGSVARGDSTPLSDIDIIVDLQPGGGNPLMRLAGLSEEFRLILRRNVDVVAIDLLKAPVAQTALVHAVPI
jgi:predicted nucleotidyltransferase